MANRPTIKPWIEGIHAYTPGKSHDAGGRKLVKLSANENPLGSSGAALEALASPRGGALYPDPDAYDLRRKLGEVHGVDPARIVCAAGSGDLLGLAAQAFAGPGDEVLYVRYGFSLYDIIARRCGATPVEAPDADYGTDAEALLALVTNKTRVVFLANPNNPTGSYMTAGEVAALHATLPTDVLFVLDQAYAEYLSADEDDNGLALAEAHDNVLVTRTFSKIYGLAGERIGWATGAPHIVDALNRIRSPFNVTVSGQTAAIAALGDQDFVRHSREHNAAELARFTGAVAALGNHGLRPLPSKANFLLILFEGALTAEAAYSGLAQRGYATRWLPGQGLSHGLRITIGTAEQMDEIATALREMAETVQ